MIHDKSDLIIELAMANVMATVKMLDGHIIQEKDEKRVNELKAQRDILLEVLRIWRKTIIPRTPYKVGYV